MNTGSNTIMDSLNNSFASLFKSKTKQDAETAQQLTPKPFISNDDLIAGFMTPEQAVKLDAIAMGKWHAKNNIPL